MLLELLDGTTAGGGGLMSNGGCGWIRSAGGGVAGGVGINGTVRWDGGAGADGGSGGKGNVAEHGAECGSVGGAETW